MMFHSQEEFWFWGRRGIRSTSVTPTLMELAARSSLVVRDNNIDTQLSRGVEGEVIDHTLSKIDPMQGTS